MPELSMEGEEIFECKKEIASRGPPATRKARFSMANCDNGYMESNARPPLQHIVRVRSSW